MEATKQVKFDELLDKPVDMSKLKLDDLKVKINNKITEIFQIEKFVYDELKLEQLVNPMKIYIHMTEFLNGPRIKQFLCELWLILLASQESAAGIPNDNMKLKKDDTLKEVIQSEHKNGHERSKSSSHSRSRIQSNMVNVGNEQLGAPKTFSSTLKGRLDIEKDLKQIEKDVKHREKRNESVSLSRSTKVEQKQLDLKPKQCIAMVNVGKQPLLAAKAFSSSLKRRGRIDICKIKLDVLKPWITKRITNILEKEDNAVVEFVYNTLKRDKMLCPQKLQIRISGFLNGDKALKFVNELWPLLLSAQESKSGIPSELEQQQNDENVKVENDIKYDGSVSVISTKPHYTKTASTSSAKKQQPDDENNKNFTNIENQPSKHGKPLTKEIDKNNSSNPSADCNSQSGDKQQKHSSRSTPNKKSSSKIIRQSRERVSDDSKTCGLNGFANFCMFSPTKQETNTRPEFVQSEYCAQTEDFLKLWNEAPDKELIVLSEKFIYPDAKNIGKQVNNALYPPSSSSSSVSKSNQNQEKRKIDFGEIVKAEEEIKTARELQARKRSHSTMVNESKKLKVNSSDNHKQKPTKKEHTKTKKSSSKHSSEKDSSRKAEGQSSKEKTNKKDQKATREFMLELFGSCSSDEEECDEDSSRKRVAESKEKQDHKKYNNKMSKLY